MYDLDRIIQEGEGSYRHVKRLLEQGFTEKQIEIKYLEKEYVSEMPRKKYRLLSLYQLIYRNKLLICFDNADKRKKVKERFFKEWKELRLPFNEYLIDNLWDTIAKEVFLN